MLDVREDHEPPGRRRGRWVEDHEGGRDLGLGEAELFRVTVVPLIGAEPHRVHEPRPVLADFESLVSEMMPVPAHVQIRVASGEEAGARRAVRLVVDRASREVVAAIDAPGLPGRGDFDRRAPSRHEHAAIGQELQDRFAVAPIIVIADVPPQPRHASVPQ